MALIPTMLSVVFGNKTYTINVIAHSDRGPWPNYTASCFDMEGKHENSWEEAVKECLEKIKYRHLTEFEVDEYWVIKDGDLYLHNLDINPLNEDGFAAVSVRMSYRISAMKFKDKKEAKAVLFLLKENPPDPEDLSRYRLVKVKRK